MVSIGFGLAPFRFEDGARSASGSGRAPLLLRRGRGVSFGAPSSKAVLSIAVELC
jgi:hypothetical protein